MGFFDNLTKKATETYKNTTEKTNKLTREMKLKSLMNEDKSKIEKIYAEIGKKVYEKHIREENIDIKSELKEECSKIDAYAKEIEDMRMELLALKDLRLCEKCAAEVPLNAKFCPKCGAPQEEKTTSNIQPEAEVVEQKVEVINNSEIVNQETEVAPEESNEEQDNNLVEETDVKIEETENTDSM